MPNQHLVLPPEWHPQSGVMLTWPHEHSDWADKLDAVEPVFVNIAANIARFERVLISAYDSAHRTHIAQLLKKANIAMDRVVLREAKSNDTWARDHGPITVLRDSRPVLHDFIFNGWGNKFNAELDDAISVNLYQQDVFGEAPLVEHTFVLEGGSLESDGHGTLLTTSECLLSPQRNPAYSRDKVEHYLKDTFGLTRVLWLEHGYLAGDDTDSHIDTLARYTDPHTIAYVKCDDTYDEHYPALSQMESELQNFESFDGKPYRLIPLPWPKARYGDDGRRLPATYANFLIINGAVLVPTYDDPVKDQQALANLKICFPDREIIGVPCLPVIQQNGSLHCLTMQLPEGVLAE